MKLVFLGTGPEEPTAERGNSALLAQHESVNILFDGGPHIADRLKRFAKGVKLDAVFITHEHPDHNPPRDKLKPFLKPDAPVLLCQGAEIDGIKISAHKVQHSIKTDTVGYLVQWNGHSFSYIPDFLRIKDKRLLDADVVIADGSTLWADKVRHFSKGDVGHQSMRKTVQQVKDAGKASLLIFTHIGRIGLNQEQLQSLLDQWSEHADFRILAAYDGMNLDLDRELKAAKAHISHLPAKILKAPHGELLAKGLKILIVSTIRFSKYLGLPVYVIQGDKCYAKIVMGQPRKLSLQEFEDLQDKHRITPQERKRWWPNARTFYAYPVQVLETYDPPKRVRWPKGAQVWIAPGQLEFLDEPPKEIGMELRLSEVQDLANYQPAREPDNQRLRDDWRILSAHYAKTLRGEKTPWPRDLILQKAYELAKVLIQRNAIVFHPMRMKPEARRLYDEVARKLQEEGIQVPHALTKEELDSIAPPFTRWDTEDLLALHQNLHYTWQDGDLNKENIWNLHELVVAELENRGVRHKVEDALDKVSLGESERQALLERLVPVVVTHDAVCLVGSAVYGSEDIHDLDWLIRSPTRCELLELALKAAYPGPSHDFIYEPKGPNWDYIPLGEFILHPIGREFPQTQLQSCPLSFLEGLAPYWVKFNFLSVNPERGEFYILSFPDPGLALKLNRIYHDLPYSVVPVEEVPPDAIPLAHLVFVPYESTEVVRMREDEFKQKVGIAPQEESTSLLQEKLELGKPFQPLKAQTGYAKYEFFDTDMFWKIWGQPNAEVGFVLEPKVDGIRLASHKIGNTVKIFTEDKKRERSSVLVDLVEDIRKLPADELILDGECVWFRDNRPIPRWEMAAIVTQKEPIKGEDLRYFVFDILWYNGKDLTSLPWAERKKYLDKVLPRHTKHLFRLPYWIIHTREELERAFEQASEYPSSEGAMAKVVNSVYDLSGRTGAWAKIKRTFELKCQVIGITRKPNPWPPGKKPDRTLTGEEALRAFKELQKGSKTYILRCAVRKGKELVPIESQHRLTPGDLELKWNADLKEPKWQGLESPEIWEMDPRFPHRKAGEYAYGNTYGRKLEPAPKIGDIVTVRPILMRIFKDEEGKLHVTWMFPILREIDPERTEPDTWEDVERIARAAERRARAMPVTESWRLPPFSSPGGKFYLAPVIVSLMPPHDRYVEPWAGSAAVLFAKLPSEEEVLNDIDRNLVDAYRAIRKLTLSGIESLKRRNWRPSKNRYRQLMQWRPIDSLDKLYRYCYLNWFGYSGRTDSFRGYAPPNWDLEARLERLWNAKNRLRHVKITCEDAFVCIDRWDSPETLFYWDPPYPGSYSAARWWGSTPTLKELAAKMKQVKGKVILSLLDTPEVRSTFKGFYILPVELPRMTGFGGRTKGGVRKELLILNFKPPRAEEAAELERPESSSSSAATHIEVKEAIEPEEEKLPRGKRPTREEQRKKLEKLMGDWYLDKSGVVLPSRLQRHVRGILYPDDLKRIREQLLEADTEEEVRRAWKEGGFVRLTAPFERIAKAAQEADDAREDVTGAIRQFVSKDPPKPTEVRKLLPQIGNMGNCHVDWRKPHSSMQYLAASWTCDVVKTVFQCLADGKLRWFLRDRIIQNEPGDQWLSQKKCPNALCPDEPELTLRIIKLWPELVAEACILAEAWWGKERYQALVDELEGGELLEAIQPLIWLRLVTKERPRIYIPPGEIGATKATAAAFLWVGDTEFVRGVSKSDYHEFFHFFRQLSNEFPHKKPEELTGRWDWKLIPGRKEYKKAPETEFWMGSRPWRTQVPYILTHDYETELEKAKKDKIQMLWNPESIPLLRKLGYPYLNPQ